MTEPYELGKGIALQPEGKDRIFHGVATAGLSSNSPFFSSSRFSRVLAGWTLACLGLLSLLVESALAVTIVYPSTVWGSNPVAYYEVQDDLGRTRVMAAPLSAGDEFLFQFESLDALFKWKGVEPPPVLVVDKVVGPGGGIESLFVTRRREEIEIARQIGHFNLRRAFTDFHIPSVEHLKMPYGMAWFEFGGPLQSTPLSLASVSQQAIFGLDEEKEEEFRAEFVKNIDAESLNPEAIAERLGLNGSPEPTILIILGVVFLMMIIAVARVNWQQMR